MALKTLTGGQSQSLATVPARIGLEDWDLGTTRVSLLAPSPLFDLCTVGAVVRVGPGGTELES